jgi:hypothetical protein
VLSVDILGDAMDLVVRDLDAVVGAITLFDHF